MSCTSLAKNEATPPSGQRALYAIGGSSLATIEFFDGASSTWSAAPGTALQHFGAALLGGKLYVVGGKVRQDNSFRRTVEAFDVQAGTWAAVAPMSVARGSPAVAAVGGRLYAIGGLSTGSLKSVEAFDPQTGAWAAVAPMAAARDGAGAAVLDGKIYVAGGYDAFDGGWLNSMEIYDPATNVWAEAAPMATARAAFGMAALGGKIYAAGGNCSGFVGEGSRGSVLSSLEAYEPRSNAWSAVAPMSTARRAFGLAVMRGRLYAVGGVSSGNTLLTTAEAYGPQRDRWETVVPMASGRCSFALVAI